MASIFDRMIDHATGELDELVIAEAIEIRAAHEWRGPDFPPKYRREAEQWCRERAESMRIAWRQARGLKVWEDHELVQMNVPDWGNSGDGFAKARR